MSPKRLPIVALLAFAATGCFSPKPLPGLTRLETAQFRFEETRYEDVTEITEWLLDKKRSSQLTAADEAEAAFLAGESFMILKQHKPAFKYYKRLLETAPWSPHVQVLEARLYDIGLALLYDEQYDGWIFDDRGRGVEVMTLLQVHFHQSDRADDALRHVADYFASPSQEEWLEASLTYEQLYTEYPQSEWAERALWLAANNRLKRVHDAGYNNGDLIKAHELLQLSRRVHPRGSSAADVRADLLHSREMLAGAELVVASFYASRGKPYGEQLRLANAALMYPETEAGKAARERLVSAGLDLDAMASDPNLSSTDSRVSRKSPWAQDDA